MTHLQQFEKLSQYAAKPLWVQGPGGNTSVKDDKGQMLVKASGVLLNEVTEQAGWVQVTLPEIMGVLQQDGLNGGESADVEKINQAVQSSVSKTARDGMRPSMETAFHCIFHRFVLHTHHALANIYLCSDRADEIASCLPESDTCFSSLVNDYYTPGAELSWILYDMFRFEEHMPQLVLLPNHGIIVSADTMEELASIHDAFHTKLCQKLNFADKDYPGFSLQTSGDGFQLICPYLEQYFSLAGESPLVFSDYLVPDQAVYLYPEYYSCVNSKAKIYFNTGEQTIQLNTTEREAVTLAEIMINGVFLHDQITRRGFEPLTINFDVDKLRNMGAEKYRRKSIGS
jgi:ribulose-5-phosphate 4-epimerase/fuculose-1-phosphate aldolase